RVATLGLALLNIGGAQIARQVAGTNDFDAVTEHQNADGCTVEVIPVHQGVDQQLFKGYLRYFQLADGVEATVVLDVVQVAFDKSKAALELLAQGAVNVFAVLIFGVANKVAKKRHRFNHAHRQPALRVGAKQQCTGDGKLLVFQQLHALQAA